MKHRWRFGWLGFCLAGIFWLMPLHAAGNQIVSTLGFNGYITPEHWVPLHIQLNDLNEPSARIEIIREEQNGSGPEQIESFLLRGLSRAEIPVFAAEHIKSLKVRLLAGDQVLAEQTLDLKSKVFPGHLVLTANIPAIENQVIEQSLLPIEPVKAVPVKIHQLPNMGLDYDGVSCLVMNDPEPVLGPAQLKALRYWLTGGGKLIIFGVNQDVFNMLSALGIKPTKPLKDSADYPLGFGNVRISRHRITDNFQGGNVLFWREWLNLKPFRDSVRFSATQCFFNEPWGQDEKKAPYPFGVMVIGFTVWTVFALLIIWRNSKNLLISFLIYNLVCAGLMIPLAGYLTANWRRGALSHNRALILPDSGGMLLASDIQMKTSRGASPWGTRITFGRDEQGRINFRGRRNTDWNHSTVYPRYSVYKMDANMMQFMGAFPDMRLDFDAAKPSLKEQGLWRIPVTMKTVLWDGKQWRVFNGLQNGKAQWVQHKIAPVWLKDDEEWLRKLQLLWPDTPWLCGRSVLPTSLQLRIQNGPAPEVIWAMPVRK